MFGGRCPNHSNKAGWALLVLLVLFCTCVPAIGLDECNRLLTSENYGQAFSCYGKAIENDPSSAMNWAGQGDVLNNMDYYNQALLYYYMALEQDPSIARIWTSKGRTYTRLGDYTDATTCLTKAVELDPNDDYAWTSIGDLLTLMEKYDDAEKAYSKAEMLKAQAKSAGKSYGKTLPQNTGEDTIFEPIGPQTADLTYNGYITFSNNRGESIDDAISIHNAKTDREGVHSEYYYLEWRFGEKGVDWELDQQSLHHAGGRVYDEMDITLSDGRKPTIYFDITDFFGKL